MNESIQIKKDIEPARIYGKHAHIQRYKKISMFLIAVGAFIFFLVHVGIKIASPLPLFFLCFGTVTAGALLYFYQQYREAPAGIRHNNLFKTPLMSGGFPGWIIAIVLTWFYIVLYWFPQFIENWIALCDPLSMAIRNKPADHWFFYGTLYTFAILIMGIRMLIKYRHNRYQIIRTSSLMFFQLCFAFLIPAFLVLLNQPEYYFSYLWPLKYDYLFPAKIHSLFKSGGLGYFMVFWTIAASFIAVPLLTYLFGKRWYCSWVCGCGGLAETLGDPFRQLSSKRLRAWQFERYSIHSVLVFVIVTTLLLWINSLTSGAVLGSFSRSFARTYGFLIGAIWAGVVGVGFYPLMGNRVWCRFGCPLAAILGIIQKYFSRFRITTNGDQCMSCGNCSTYCEMGIDVRWYAQRSQNIIRASCVGCGICAAVCPRGVLKLENGTIRERYDFQK
ncbi:MAG: 4Fe-4S ferredoxin [Candidatus Fischerbacteria bacterium RBG_13_37_8]|uniref:4Fe-4S ferredoxin n=1 Tax=Candidatus Fischerbacteria bacterium RBG_13_37_8 TaxID=1817863 RepID=A0A1F5VKZ5_9BACT|nr:MAG: 4Fe-4S ferredoxin [Candidatus Fischerbacteria bacterium RBG_13_37_8]